MVKIVNDNQQYARMVKFIKRRSSLNEDSVAGMTEILDDADKAREVFDAAKASMGTDISDIDMV